ncbi:hypothetical protein ACFO4E_13345 [Nocardiopsis mangrovi]|uniref:Uncharacterized protein n=1 Tax=Nocardiopsis mangrovi TaxID=1179818 RepID=A0ABV9DVA4_9ACTN
MIKTWLEDAERAPALLSGRTDVVSFEVSAEFGAILTAMIEKCGGPLWSIVVDVDRPGGPPEFGNMAAEACV